MHVETSGLTTSFQSEGNYSPRRPLREWFDEAIVIIGMLDMMKQSEEIVLVGNPMRKVKEIHVGPKQDWQGVRIFSWAFSGCAVFYLLAGMQ